MLRPEYVKTLRSAFDIKNRVDDPLIKVSITYSWRLILHYFGKSSLFFRGGHLVNHPKWPVGPNTSRFLLRMVQ